MMALDHASTVPPPPEPHVEDPFGDDLPTDEMVVVSRRSLVRLALVATETASRFERDRIVDDPMAWLLLPRDLFGGLSAVDACLARDACLAAVLLHGLSLDLDSRPADIEALTSTG